MRKRKVVWRPADVRDPNASRKRRSAQKPAKPADDHPSPRKALEVDALVGAKLRHLRLAKGLSRQEVGQLVGLGFQQVAKLESGSNRVSAGRLWLLARVLDTSVATLFEGAPASDTPELVAAPETARLVEAYLMLTDPALRIAFRELARALSESR